MNATANPTGQSAVADWSRLLGFTRIFRTFSVASHPPKLLLALLLVLSLYLLGRLMDLGGGRYYTGEFAEYVMRDRASFGTWRVNQLEPGSGLFAAALELELTAFQRMVGGAAALNFGIAEGLDPARHDASSVIGALREMFLSIPAWLLDIHPWFSIVYGLAALGIWALLGGAIYRLAAVHLARGTTIAPAEAVQFATARWHWFFLAPLLPIAAILVVGIVLAIAGFIFLNWPVLNMVGGLGFGLALAGGAIIALLLIAWVTGVHLLGPAIATESTDAFDAVSRAFSYVLSRPWRWLWYTVLSLVYGALTYLFVGLVVFLTLGVTRFFVGWWMTRTAGRYGAPWLDAALPAPLIGKFHYTVDWAALDATGKVAAGLMAVWVYVLMGVLVAYAISFYIAAQTNIYLLLRQSADGTPTEEIFQEADESTTGSAQPGAGPSDATPAQGAEPSTT